MKSQGRLALPMNDTSTNQKFEEYGDTIKAGQDPWLRETCVLNYMLYMHVNRTYLGMEARHGILKDGSSTEPLPFQLWSFWRCNGGATRGY